VADLRDRAGSKSKRPAGPQLSLTAYPVSESPLPIVPATVKRSWMFDPANRQRPSSLSQRCLPLLIANQSGWFILNSHRFFAVWNGGDQPSDLKIVYQSGAPPYPAFSHFGCGIITWRIPYLFRTPPGYNLLARGPANWPKDGACPLEGVIETDWAESTFTMSWQLTRPKVPIIFGVDEPICMIVPQRRGELESFRPEIRSISTDRDLQDGYEQFRDARKQFQEEASIPGSRASKQVWQRHYFQGAAVSGSGAIEHQTKLNLHPFRSAVSEDA
jgi:hypothetical protein